MEKKELEFKRIAKSGDCELCAKPITENDELTGDFENCEIYVHKECLARAKFYVSLDWTDHN